MQILVIGGTGLLGGHLSFSIKHKGWIGTTWSRHQPSDFEHWVPFSDPSQLVSMLDETKWDVVVNCLAITSFETCEQNPEFARLVNARWPELWAKACAARDVRFLQVSTDAVFPGTGGLPYREDSPTGPVNQYGQSKLEGEQRVLQANQRALVIRTNFFGWSRSGGSGILDYFYRNLKAGNTVDAFTDYFTSSIYAGQLIDVLFKLCWSDVEGLLHVGSARPMSKFEFARRVAAEFGFPCKLVTPGASERLSTRRAAFLGIHSGRAFSLLNEPVPETTTGLSQAGLERDGMLKHLRQERTPQS